MSYHAGKCVNYLNNLSFFMEFLVTEFLNNSVDKGKVRVHNYAYYQTIMDNYEKYTWAEGIHC